MDCFKPTISLPENSIPRSRFANSNMYTMKESPGEIRGFFADPPKPALNGEPAAQSLSMYQLIMPNGKSR
jgi:hypothetical protein